MNVQNIPVACELFRQWVKARGLKRSTASRDFIRSWRHIEESAIFAEAPESETIRDLRDLEREGWLKITPEKYYRHRIAKVRIPLNCEARWKEAFGFVVLDKTEAERIASWSWANQLDFLRTTRVFVPFDDLRSLDEYLKARERNPFELPIKERSIEIFGDEKRLDELYRGSLLFRNGHLTLTDLDCYLVAEPLAWVRGRLSTGPVIVLENAATWDSFRRWDKERPRFSAIVYGGGERFRDGVRRMDEVFEELGGQRPIVYFGDLDAMGLRIPRLASRVAVSLNYPAIRPEFECYASLIEIAQSVKLVGAAQLEAERPSSEDLDWLEALNRPAEALIVERGRVAQELLNLRCLMNFERRSFSW